MTNDLKLSAEIPGKSLWQIFLDFWILGFFYRFSSREALKIKFKFTRDGNSQIIFYSTIN